MKTLQVGEVPEQAPVHFLKEEPGPALAVRVTVVPAALCTLQPEVDPDVQFTPLPETVPDPEPAVATESW